MFQLLLHITVGVLFMLICSGCRSWHPQVHTEQPIFMRNVYWMHPKAKSVTIPFRLANNLMIIPVSINGSDSLRFIVDTGVKTPLITSLNVSDSLQFSNARKIKIRGLGAGDDLEALLSYGNVFAFTPQLSARNHDLLILLQDVFMLSKKLGMYVNGIIGYDFFKDFIVEIDYETRRLVLHRPQYYRKKLRGYSLPMEIVDGKPYVECYVKQCNGKRAKVRLLIDTGASSAVSLDVLSHPDIHYPTQYIEAYLGQGLSGDIHGKLGRIESLEIGKYVLKNVTASFPDSASLGMFAGSKQRNGQLGADVLKRFRVWMDYEGGRIYLKPNSFFKEPFHYNLSGMEVITPIPGLPLFTISEVSPHSPAAEAGLLPGDEILHINRRSAFSFRLTEIMALFQSKPGRKISISVRRGTQIITTQLVLRKPI
ncbi:MAG: aspartyl protease family protein [Cytophagales bacterium]|nr:aspartyl protease family protein [Bernardetiaceae bacterium]MDW8203400.1 aspartyl protease family protein [Cytophagales bacterium]